MSENKKLNWGMRMINQDIKINTKVLTPTKGIGVFKGWKDQNIARVTFTDDPSERATLYRDIDLIEID